MPVHDTKFRNTSHQTKIYTSQLFLDTSARAFIRGIFAYVIYIEISCTGSFMSHEVGKKEFSLSLCTLMDSSFLFDTINLE